MSDASGYSEDFNEEINHLDAKLKAHKRRLNALELRFAKLGLESPVSIETEIEDIKKEMQVTKTRLVQELEYEIKQCSGMNGIIETLHSANLVLVRKDTYELVDQDDLTEIFRTQIEILKWKLEETERKY
jgi:hypothetical protein